MCVHTYGSNTQGRAILILSCALPCRNRDRTRLAARDRDRDGVGGRPTRLSFVLRVLDLPALAPPLNGISRSAQTRSGQFLLSFLPRFVPCFPHFLFSFALTSAHANDAFHLFSPSSTHAANQRADKRASHPHRLSWCGESTRLECP
jgi:hypothetical protein